MHRDIMGAPYLPCSYAAIRLLPTIYTRDRLSMLRGARTGRFVPCSAVWLPKVELECCCTATRVFTYKGFVLPKWRGKRLLNACGEFVNGWGSNAWATWSNSVGPHSYGGRRESACGV